MTRSFGPLWRWSALAVVAAAGVFAATAATSGSAATQDTTTATTATTTTTTGSGAPVNTAAPAISGTAQDNGTLSATSGTWTGAQPITYAYAWQRCDANGANCAAIGGATSQTYRVSSNDVGHTVRAVVTATNSGGNTTAASPASSVVTAAASTTTTAPAPPPTTTTGCPSGAAGSVVPVASINAPALLQVNNFTPVPGTLTGSVQSFTLKIVVTDTCNQKVSGALVYATAVPFNQFSVPAEVATGSDGTATLTFNRDTAFPASRRQELLAMFVRARKPGDPVLAGIAARRLIAVPVSLRG